MVSRSVLTALAVVLCATVAGVAAGPASAAEDGGWKETNTNLAIRPAPNDPAEDAVDPARPVMFVVMPVTKAVRSVELGDLRTASGCTTQTKANVVVEEHRDGEPFNAPDRTWTSTAVQQLPLTPGKVKWDVPRVKMEKGVGYAFRVVPWTATDFPTCMSARFTTWAHDRQSVVGGKRHCTPPAGGPGDRRMWQDKDDPLDTSAAAAAECKVNNWRKDMPTGWLFAWPDGGNPGQRTLVIGVNTSSSVPPSGPGCVPTSTRYKWGGVWKWWYHNITEGRHYWVCYLDDMYLPWGEQAVDTSKQWHYALPWIAGRQPTTRNGGPRDMHLTLETIDYGALMYAHKPILRYGAGENYFADSAEMMTYWPQNKLVNYQSSPFGDPIADHDDSTGAPMLRIDLLGPSYQPPVASAFNPPNESDRLVQGGDPKAAADEMRGLGFANRTYARVVYGNSGTLWLQYWFFYYYNDWSDLSVFGRHQGDWEMIQVSLDDDLNPSNVVYAQHGGPKRCAFGNVVVPGTSSPEVFVANASHASYMEAGKTTVESVGYANQSIQIDDSHWGDRDVSPQPGIEPVTGELNFLGWPGHWGADPPTFGKGGSPAAPSQQRPWKNPDGFFDGEDVESCFQSASKRKRNRRRIAPAYTRRLPRATIHAAARNGTDATVRYSAAATKLREPLYVEVVVQPGDSRNPSSTERRRLTPGRRTVSVRLPRGGAPYTVEARVLDGRNRYGRKTVRRLR